MDTSKTLTDFSKDELITMITDLKKQKKYGLIWEDQPEVVEEMMKTHLPVLEEREDMKIIKDASKPHNLLLEGDNLHSLKVLEKTHKEAVDVIYIDPPYNTGNKDFMYNDHFVDKEDAWRHSSWLSFMSKRLRIARDLLTDEGVIFISIDDNEMAQLKLLCDEVFGEANFVTTLHVEMSATQGMKVKAAQNGNIVKNSEYVLIYSKNGHKNIMKNKLYDHRDEYDTHYSKIMVGNTHKKLLDYVMDSQPEIKNELNLLSDLLNKKLNLKEAYKYSVLYQDYVHENSDKIFAFDKVTGFTEEDVKEEEINEVIRRGKSYTISNRNGKIWQLLFLNKSMGQTHDFYKNEGLRKIRGDWWKGFYLDMGNVSKEGDVVFRNGKKPIRLIKQLIFMASNKNSTILDFFAGSGTTGHSVLELNEEDDGERQFILCTNNEISQDIELDYLVGQEFLPVPPRVKNSKIYKQWYQKYSEYKKTNDYFEAIEIDDFQKLGIARAVTYDRLSRVINGYETSNGKSVVSLPGNLHYYKTEFVDKRELSFGNQELVERLDTFISIKENTYDSTDLDGITVLSSLETQVFIYPNDYIDKDDARRIDEQLSDTKENIIYIQKENKVDKYINALDVIVKFVPEDFFKGGDLSVN